MNQIIDLRLVCDRKNQIMKLIVRGHQSGKHAMAIIKLLQMEYFFKLLDIFGARL